MLFFLSKGFFHLFILTFRCVNRFLQFLFFCQSVIPEMLCHLRYLFSFFLIYLFADFCFLCAHPQCFLPFYSVVEYYFLLFIKFFLFLLLHFDFSLIHFLFNNLIHSNFFTRPFSFISPINHFTSTLLFFSYFSNDLILYSLGKTLSQFIFFF